MSKSLRESLIEVMSTASKAERAIANYMLAGLSTLPFETAASLAAKVEVSEATVGRFCRAIGYRSFKDLKNRLRQEIGEAPWLISDRLRELQSRNATEPEQLTRGLELEIAALVAVYEIAQSPEWNRVAKRLAQFKSIYVTGFQTERGMAQIFVNQLQYLRGGVHLIDLAGGNFAELLAAERDDVALVIFEARRYSQMALLLAQEAKAADIPVTLVTDLYCDWGRDLVDEMFVVPTDFNLFWESTAQMASLANLLVNSIFIEMGPEAGDRMNKTARLYSRFTGYIGGPVNALANIRRHN